MPIAQFLSVLLFGWLIVHLPFSPAAILRLPNNRVFGGPPESGKYVPPDGEVAVLIVVRKLVSELQSNLTSGGPLIELAISRQLIKHPLGYLLGCGHEPLPMSLYQVWVTTKTRTAFMGVGALAA